MIQENFSLKTFNTFGVVASTKYFAEAQDLKSLQEILFWYEGKTFPLLVLGGGSNILFTQKFQGLVLKNSIIGAEVIKTNDEFVWVKALGGENWHEFVCWVVENEWGGLENLSLIPGQVGTAPIQNIGAYGVEQASCFESLEALEIATGNIKTFTKEDCKFGYRDSIFKGREKKKWIIISVTYRLNKVPKLHIEYGAIKEVLSEKKIKEPTLKLVHDAIVTIRKSKLPDPQKLGNAGSFFKNPVIKKSVFEAFSKSFDPVPHFKVGPFEVKIPAGWLIEQCGWKGKKVGNCGVHKDQALVIVNFGGATGLEILKFSKEIKKSVKEKFGIELEREVNVI